MLNAVKKTTCKKCHASVYVYRKKESRKDSLEYCDTCYIHIDDNELDEYELGMLRILVASIICVTPLVTLFIALGS